MTLTTTVHAALGDRVSDLWRMTLLPSYNQRITSIMPAIDVLEYHGQLLPEEYAEFLQNYNDIYAVIKQLEELRSNTTIPKATRQFISLVVSSFNMHVFDLFRMSMKDVFTYVK